MSLGEDHFDSVVVKNLSCLLVVELDIKFVVNFGEFFDPWDASKRIEISDFLNGISCVRHMIISAKIVQVIYIYIYIYIYIFIQQFMDFFLFKTSLTCLYYIYYIFVLQALDLYSKVGMIPKFNNLSRLEAVFHGKLLQFLPTFLECCPNLKHLVLVKPLLSLCFYGYVYY